MAKPAVQVPGQIGSSDLYTVDEFKRRLGLNSMAVWRARRKGLRVYKLARQHYILGKDYIAYVETAGKLSRRTRQHDRTV